MERVPTEVNPAGLPSIDRDLSFETELAAKLGLVKDTLSMYDFPWMVLPRVERAFSEPERNLLRLPFQCGL